MKIRRLRGSDKKQWIDMRCKLWPGSRARVAADARMLYGRRGFVCFIAWNDGHAVGFAEAFIRDFANGCDERPVPFLEGLWVAPSYRRQGFGRELVKAVGRWAMAKGHRELGSDALLDNNRSHKVHKSYGFQETERVVYFKKNLNPSQR